MTGTISRYVQDIPPYSWEGSIVTGWVDCGHDPGHWVSAYTAYDSVPFQLFPLPSMYQTKAVIIAMIITAVVSISVTIFCFQTKVRMEKAFPGHPALYTHTFGFGTWAGLGGPRTLWARGFPSLMLSSHV